LFLGFFRAFCEYPNKAKSDPDKAKSDPDKAKSDPDKVKSDPDKAKSDPDLGSMLDVGSIWQANGQVREERGRSEGGARNLCVR